MFNLKLELEVYDTTELGLVQQLMGILTQYRTDNAKQRVEAMKARETAAQQQPTPVTPPAPTTPPQAAAEEEATEKDAVEALRKVLQTPGLGIPAAREIFNALGVQKVSELSGPGRAAFVLRATQKLQSVGGGQ